MDVNNKATINTHPAIAITVPMLPLPNCGKTAAAGTAALPFNALPYMNNPPFIKYYEAGKKLIVCRLPIRKSEL